MSSIWTNLHHTKKLWIVCEGVAISLNKLMKRHPLFNRYSVDKSDVYSYLMTEIKAHDGMMGRINELDPSVLEDVTKLFGWQRLWDDFNRATTNQHVDIRGAVSMAMWYVTKVGNVELAEKAFNLAKEACK